MVTHTPPQQDASAHPPRPQDPRSDPFANEPSESIWEDIAPRQNPAPSAGHQNVPRKQVPASLRPGPFASNDEAEDNVWAEARTLPVETNNTGSQSEASYSGVTRSQTNPFRNKLPDTVTAAPPVLPPLPQMDPPTDSFSNMTFGETNANPWKPEEQPQYGSSTGQPQPSFPTKIEDDPWAETQANPPPPQLQPPTAPPALVSVPSEEGSGWDDELRPRNDKAPDRPPMTAMSDELIEEQHVWDDIGATDKGKGRARAESSHSDDWNLIDMEPSSGPSGQPAEEPTEDKPALPDRKLGETPRWVPTRQPVDGSTETYQVKNIHWHDPSTTLNPRKSPILVQNANGPCPLVALVNALTMTTPADIPDTALVNVLRSREQVSLNLLLDAVFDELMSPRRTGEDVALPDVGDLYAFLQSLHTGMNVNPRFVPTPQMVNAYKRTSLTHLHPTERGDLIPGTFENTDEMGLYATFSIPLIHGWLPPRSEPVYEAMERQAGSYEDVQNLLFREEELESKLLSPGAGLSEQEQQLYQDILTIKSFLSVSATQLTPWGIEVIGKAIRPGTFAILFRNDHFSTLYCHPNTMQLLTLVTDAGYRRHDEVVWESLVDVNGEHAEFLSGDYRLVGAGELAGQSSGGDQGGEWTTVGNKHGKGREQEEETPVGMSSHEQEDRDLALALQLQEEEEQRHREEETRRQREAILSEQYIEQQGRQPTPNRGRGGSRGGAARGVPRGSPRPSGTGVRRPSGNSDLVPGRRSSNSVNIPVTLGVTTGVTSGTPPRQQPAQQVRPLIPPRRQGVNRTTESGGDEAPPSYEQAAHDRAYMPPPGHPSHANSSAEISRETTRTSEASSAPRVVSQHRQMGPQGGRRPPVSPGAVMGSGPPPQKDRDCVVM